MTTTINHSHHPSPSVKNIIIKEMKQKVQNKLFFAINKYEKDENLVEITAITDEQRDSHLEKIANKLKYMSSPQLINYLNQEIAKKEEHLTLLKQAYSGIQKYLETENATIKIQQLVERDKKDIQKSEQEIEIMKNQINQLTSTTIDDGQQMLFEEEYSSRSLNALMNNTTI